VDLVELEEIYSPNKKENIIYDITNDIFIRYQKEDMKIPNEEIGHIPNNLDKMLEQSNPIHLPSHFCGVLGAF